MMNKIISDLRAHCEQYGRRESVADVATKYVFENGREIKFHCGKVVGDLKDALAIVGEKNITSGEREE